MNESVVVSLPQGEFVEKKKLPVESIRNARLNYWTDANDELREINRHRFQSSRTNDFRFKANVFALYCSVRSKFKKYEANETAKSIIALKLDNFFLEPDEFDLKTALEAFILLTDFLEVLGVM